MTSLLECGAVSLTARFGHGFAEYWWGTPASKADPSIKASYSFSFLKVRFDSATAGWVTGRR
jgi:hypothetical protein